MAEITDPKLKFLNIRSDKDNRKEHNTAVVLIASALSKLGIEINYDHVDSVLPKNREIPLSSFTKKRTHKADLAFMLHSNVLVHVHVDVFQRGPPLAIMNNANTEQIKKMER